MTVFVITESNNDSHHFTSHIGDEQKAYAEYMICAASKICASDTSRSIQVEILFDVTLSPAMKAVYKKSGILLESE